MKSEKKKKNQFTSLMKGCLVLVQTPEAAPTNNDNNQTFALKFFTIK